MGSNSTINSNEAVAFARASHNAGAAAPDDAQLQHPVPGSRNFAPFGAMGHAAGNPSLQATDDLADIDPDDRYPRGLRIAFLVVGSAGLWAIMIAAVVHVISRR